MFRSGKREICKAHNLVSQKEEEEEEKHNITSNCFTVIKNLTTNNEIFLCVNFIPFKPFDGFGHNGYGRTP